MNRFVDYFRREPPEKLHRFVRRFVIWGTIVGMVTWEIACAIILIGLTYQLVTGQPVYYEDVQLTPRGIVGQMAIVALFGIFGALYLKFVVPRLIKHSRRPAEN